MIAIFFRSTYIAAPTIVILLFLFVILYLTNSNYRTSAYESKFIIFFIFWLCFVGIQMMYVPHTDSAISHVKSLIFGVLMICLLTRFVRSTKELKLVYKFWGICAVISVLLGMYEIVTGNSISPNTAYPWRSVATVSFFNQNDFSFFVALSFPLFLRWIEEKFFLKMLGFLMVGCSFYIAFINETRSVLLILFAVMVIFMMHLLYIGRTKLFMFLLIVAVAVVIANFNFILDSLAVISTITGNDTSVDARKQLTGYAYGVFRDHPVIGVGPGNLEHYMPVIGYKAHNFWLEILANYGILIFTGLALFFVVSIYTFARKAKGETKKHIWPLLITTIILIPGSFVSSSMFQFNIVWFMFALMLCGINIVNSDLKQKQNSIVE